MEKAMKNKLVETFSNSIYLRMMKQSDESAVMQISAVFGTRLAIIVHSLTY